MKGYFSRLMEQSGIPVGPAAEPASTVRDVTPQAGLEEVVEFRKQIGKTGRNPEAVSEVSGKAVEEVVEVRSEQTVHRAAPSPRWPADRRGRSGRSEAREPVPHGQEWTPPSTPENLAASADAVEGEADDRHHINPDRATLEEYVVVESATNREGEIVNSGTGVLGEARASSNEGDSRDRTDRELVWQRSFEEVREWVAEPPVLTPGVGDVGRAEVGEDTGIPLVEDRIVAARPRQAEPHPRDEPQTRDLRLEIGTISVTVEEPRSEVPDTARRADVPAREPADRGGHTRLGRHYIRVG